MTKAYSVAVPLSRHHCRATAWWLLARYVPYALERWRRTRSEPDAQNAATAIRLGHKFERFAKRRLLGNDQDRDADRTMTRGDAAWLAAMILHQSSENFPHVVPPTDLFQTTEHLAAMPLPAARAILFGLGTYESMRRCHQRVYSRQPGPNLKSLTLADVENKRVGNPVDGGDERYERRLRKRAREDDIAAEIALEWNRAMRAVEARSDL